MLHADHACLLDLVAWNGILIFEPETFFERILSCLKIKKQNIGYNVEVTGLRGFSRRSG
jgi:hypothetical protein